MIPMPVSGCRRVAAAALFAISLLSAGAASAADAGDYLLDARKRYAAGEHSAALIQLKNVLQLDPNHVDGRLLLARTYSKLKEPEAALEQLEMATQLGATPAQTSMLRTRILAELHRYADIVKLDDFVGYDNAERSEWHYLRGFAYLELGKPAQAKGEFARARDFAPGSGGPIAGLAVTLLRNGDLSGAREILAEAKSVAPNDSRVLQAQAAIHVAEGDLNEAIAAYDRALLADPENDWTRLKRASVLLDTRRFEDAERELAILVSRAPHSPRVLFMHARALTALGRKDAAEEVISHASSRINGIPPERLAEDPPLLLLAASITYGNGEFNAARDYLDVFINAQPVHVPARHLMASTLIRLGKPLDAVATLRTLTSRGLADVQTFALLGEAYSIAGMHADAVGALEKAGQEGLANAEVLGHLGVSRLAQGQSASGIAALEAAVDLDPDTVLPRLYLADIYQRRGQSAKAHAVIDELLRRQPDHLTGLNTKANLHATAGQYANARELFARILEIAPDFRPAHVGLAKLDSIEGDHSAARERLARLLIDTPEDTSLVRGMALAEINAGKENIALELLQRALDTSPDDIEIGRSLIQLLIRMDRTEQALTLALRLKSRHPQNLEVLETVARAQLIAGERQDAVQTLRSMSALATTAPGTLVRISRLARRAGDDITALNALIKAVAQHPNQQTLRSELAELYLSLGKISQAQTQAKLLTEQYPDSPSGPLLSAEIALRNGQAREALELYARISGVEDSPSVAIKRLRARSMLGEQAKGINELSAWIEKHPEHPRPRRVLAAALHAAGDLKEAQRHYEALVTEQSADVNLLNNLAYLYQQIGDPRALATAQRAYRLKPDHAPTLDTLGWLYVQLGEPQKGLPLLREALEKVPESGDVRFHLAMALDAIGRRTEAVKELKVALSKPGLAERKKAQQHLHELELTLAK